MRADLSGLSEFADYIEIPLSPHIEPDKQIQLMDYYLPEGGTLTLKCDLGFRFGRAVMGQYRRCWPFITMKDAVFGADIGEDTHPLNDEELFWLIGETQWFCTARRRGRNCESCAAYSVNHRKGTMVTKSVIREQYPGSFGMLGKYDFNPLSHLEIYSYEAVDSDGELADFLFTYPTPLDANENIGGWLI